MKKKSDRHEQNKRLKLAKNIQAFSEHFKIYAKSEKLSHRSDAEYMGIIKKTRDHDDYCFPSK